MGHASTPEWFGKYGQSGKILLGSQVAIRALIPPEADACTRDETLAPDSTTSKSGGRPRSWT